MPSYEIMFIVNPNATDDEIDKINSQLENVVAAAGGKVEKVEKIGKRKLAYAVQKFTDGFYVLFTITAPGDAVRELERRLRVMDAVVKYLTVRMDEDMKRLEKIKMHRQKRAAKRGAHAAAAVAEPEVEQGEV